MEDRFEDPLYTNFELSLRLLGCSCYPLAFLIENLSLSARTRPNHRQSSAFNPYLHCLPDFLQDLYGNPQENHNLLKS